MLKPVSCIIKAPPSLQRSLRRHCPRYRVPGAVINPRATSRPLLLPHRPQLHISQGPATGTAATLFTTTSHQHLIQRSPSEEEMTEDNEEWKSKPPYRTAGANEEFEKKWTATCHCARVKYWLSRDKPLASKYCHCIDCQSLHGEYLTYLREDRRHRTGGVVGVQRLPSHTAISRLLPKEKKANWIPSAVAG